MIHDPFGDARFPELVLEEASQTLVEAESAEKAAGQVKVDLLQPEVQLQLDLFPLLHFKQQGKFRSDHPGCRNFSGKRLIIICFYFYFLLTLTLFKRKVQFRKIELNAKIN